MEYDKNKNYVFKDAEGNTVFTSKGDNQYVQQSITQGIPIYINDRGEWYTEPYLESTPTGIVLHNTDWFKGTDEYNEWNNTWLPQIKNATLNVDNFNKAKDILKGLSNQGLLRYTTYNQAEDSGITDPAYKKFVFDQYLSAVNEGANKVNANLAAYGSTDGETVADMARWYKGLSKEDLSKRLLQWERILNKENTKDSQEEKANVLATYKILNLVADNPADFGDGKEFEGLLEASEWQKFQSHIANVLQTISEGMPIVTFGARLGSGVSSGLQGEGFGTGWQIENRRNQQYGFLRSEATGGGLRGTEGSAVSGNVAGSVINMAGTMAQSAVFGTFLNSKIASDSAGTALNTIGKFANTVAGGMVYDFFANDLPVDLSLFAVDLSRTGSAGEAWESQTGETQPLLGLFGPQVPAGLKYNLIGDAVLDLTMPIISVGNKAIYNKLDNITGGGVTKLRENVALKNLSAQQKLSDTPIIGTAGQKFSNWLFGAENASFVREMRKQAIIEKSLTPYIDAQNLLTLKNHYGAEVVAPYYQKLLKDYDINGQLKTFKKNANEYGGIGEVKVEWDQAKAGVSKHLTETVMDDLPRQVKAGLLDYQRLEELRGERAIEGEGLISNPKRDKQITELERRVEALPDEIKKFAQDFSNLNKAVENMATMLGIKSEDWLNALLEDPRWKNYMVRQVLLPGGSRGAGSLDPATNKILTGRRTGYYNPDQTLSPVMALDMKVHALGNAYAWNERAKAIVGAELAQGKISAGATSIEIAEKIKAKRAEIAAQESATAKLGYDAIAQGYSNRMFDLGSAAKKMNDELSSFENLTVRSVYTQGEAPATKELVSDYESGKITWAEGVRENSGLSVQDGDSLIQNTYRMGDSHASVTSDGVPYEYTIENDKITSVTKITSDEGLAESLTGVNQYWKTTPETAGKLGEQNVAAMNRAAMFYRDNLPTIKVENNIVFDPTLRKGEYGVVLANPRLSFNEDNTLNIHFESRVNPYYYLKGNEEKTLKAMKGDTEVQEFYLPGRTKKIKGSWHPKNSDDLAQTFIHESTHTVMQQLTQLEENIKIKEGTRLYHYTNRMDFYNAKLDMEDRVLMAAAGRIGERFNDDLRLSISVYAAYPREIAKRNAETITEAFVDYSFNGAEAAPFSQAIVQEVSSRLQKHSMAINPRETLKANNLNTPKGLFKGNDYAFPASVKTQAQKAEWLDGWRKNNPYLKKEFTDETFRKANLWDSYFQKEITSFDPNYKTSAPETLLSKSGDFVEARRAKIAKSMTSTIKKLSGGEFDSDLAMIMMGRNGKDIAAAMENYIIRQIDVSAEDLAKNMDGGLTPDNLNTARITLWSDKNLKTSTIEMLNNLVPGGTLEVDSMVDVLFKKQADGLAAYDKLTTDAKELIAEKDKLVKQLYKENEKTMKLGKKMDKNSSYIDGGTHLIHYREGGEEVYVAVNDPVVATMLEKPYDYKELGLVGESIVQISNFLATTYRLGTTSVNPMSFIRNVLRDPIQATVTAGFNPLSMTLSPEVFYKSLRQYGLDDDTILEVTNRIRNWATSSTLTQEMRIGTSRSSATYRNNVEKVSKRLNSVTNGKIITALSAPLETWEGFFRNQVGQQSFVRNLRRTGDVDKALSSALFDTSNATTNFSHAIGKFKRATGTIPYLSSAINGTVSFARLFNIDPMGMVTRITAGFMVPVMAITAWNLGNEDNRRAYETLPEWFKQSHLVLTDGSGNVIAFPLPEEIQQFAGTARKLIEFTNEVSPYSLATIVAQGAFGFLPFDVDGFWGDDGSFQLKEGAFQMASGLLPQAATTLYELIWQQDLFTGEDLSTYNGLNTTINTLSNIFGTGIKQVANSLGIMAGVSEKDIIGKSFQDTIARDLFGMGFDAAKTQFMNIVGSPAKLKEDGSMSTPTGLFKENEELKKKVDALSAKIAVATDSEKAGLEEQKQKLIDDFTNRVVNLMNNYQRMFQLTGGLEAWQKNRLVQVLTLGDAWSSGSSESYQAEAASEAYLNERGLAQQRYVQAGLPAGPDLENLVGSNSIELQAALNRFYGGPKQAATDYRNAVESTGLKDIRNEFYNVMQQIYDAAEEQGAKPDYDLIEKIQARYLQAVDTVLVPIINQYGINILNNSDFIDAVRKQVNGMIPSDDWRQSARNAKKFLSSKDFPTTTVDVKKWLTQRYTSGMRNRNIASDPEVTQKLEEIRIDIDAGRGGAAKGKIQALMSGIQKANYYISSDDFMTLTQYNNMLK